MAVCLSASALPPLRQLWPKRLLRMTERSAQQQGLCDNGTNETPLMQHVQWAFSIFKRARWPTAMEGGKLPPRLKQLCA